MLQVLILSLFTSSSAFTTHRYDVYNLGNHRPNTPHLDNIFEYASGDGRRPVQMYEYPTRPDGVVISDVVKGPVVDSEGDGRRVDTPHNYQNQWNRQVPWYTVSVTEPTKLFSRFEDSNQDRNVYNPDTNNTQPAVRHDIGHVTNQMYGVDNINQTEGIANVAHTSTQSDDDKRSLVIQEKRVTWNNDHHSTSKDNANIATRSINSDNYTNSLNVPSKQTPDDINLSTETNNSTVYNTNDNMNEPNNQNDNTKTTRDNEVTPRTNDQRRKANEGDRWIWSNGEDQVLETTTVFDFGDRAAFAGDSCPTGKTKVGSMCVVRD